MESVWQVQIEEGKYVISSECGKLQEEIADRLYQEGLASSKKK